MLREAIDVGNFKPLAIGIETFEAHGTRMVIFDDNTRVLWISGLTGNL
jgi:hypothetical protein